MNSCSNDDNAPDPEPWANDERLKDPMQVGTVNKAIRLIKLLAAALEKASVAPMPKTQSIPMLWESAKELKQKNFEDLQNACLEHEAYVMSPEKFAAENARRAQLSIIDASLEESRREQRERAETRRAQRDRDKRPAEEISSAEDDGPTVFKQHKRVPLGSDAGNDEGTYATSSPSRVSLRPLLCTHVCCSCYGTNNRACYRSMRLLGCIHLLTTLLNASTWMHMPATSLHRKLLLPHTIATNIG